MYEKPQISSYNSLIANASIIIYTSYDTLEDIATESGLEIITNEALKCTEYGILNGNVLNLFRKYKLNN